MGIPLESFEKTREDKGTVLLSHLPNSVAKRNRKQECVKVTWVKEDLKRMQNILTLDD